MSIPQSSYTSRLSRVLGGAVTLHLSRTDDDPDVVVPVATALMRSGLWDRLNAPTLRLVLLEVLPAALAVPADRVDEVVDACIGLAGAMAEMPNGRVAPSTAALATLTDALRPEVHAAFADEARWGQTKRAAGPSSGVALHDTDVHEVRSRCDALRDDAVVDDPPIGERAVIRMAQIPARSDVEDAAAQADLLPRAVMLLADIDAGAPLPKDRGDRHLVQWMLDAGWLRLDRTRPSRPRLVRTPAASAATDDPVSAVVSLLRGYEDSLAMWDGRVAGIRGFIVPRYRSLLAGLAGSRRHLDVDAIIDVLSDRLVEVIDRFETYAEDDDDPDDPPSPEGIAEDLVRGWVDDLVALGVVALVDPFLAEVPMPGESLLAGTMPTWDSGARIAATPLGRHALAALDMVRPFPPGASDLPTLNLAQTRFLAGACDVEDAADVVAEWAGDDPGRWRALAGQDLSAERSRQILLRAMVLSGDPAAPAAAALLDGAVTSLWAAGMVREWRAATNRWPPA